MIELLNEFRNVSVILDNEMADILARQLLDEEISFIETDEYELEEMLNNEPFFIISKNSYTNFDEEYVIEPLLKEYAEQYYLENDYVIVQDDLVDIVDFDVIEAEEILTFKVEECEECDDEEEFCDCEICEAYSGGYEVGYLEGYERATQEVKDFLNGLAR